ncbi:MAG: hypothetical protein R2882_04095 [Gemmatimonadales bacterium]
MNEGGELVAAGVRHGEIRLAGEAGLIRRGRDERAPGPAGLEGDLTLGVRPDPANLDAIDRIGAKVRHGVEGHGERRGFPELGGVTGRDAAGRDRERTPRREGQRQLRPGLERQQRHAEKAAGRRHLRTGGELGKQGQLEAGGIRRIADLRPLRRQLRLLIEARFDGHRLEVQGPHERIADLQLREEIRRRAGLDLQRIERRRESRFEEPVTAALGVRHGVAPAGAVDPQLQGQVRLQERVDAEAAEFDLAIVHDAEPDRHLSAEDQRDRTADRQDHGSDGPLAIEGPLDRSREAELRREPGGCPAGDHQALEPPVDHPEVEGELGLEGKVRHVERRGKRERPLHRSLAFERAEGEFELVRRRGGPEIGNPEAAADDGLGRRTRAGRRPGRRGLGGIEGEALVDRQAGEHPIQRQHFQDDVGEVRPGRDHRHRAPA